MEEGRTKNEETFMGWDLKCDFIKRDGECEERKEKRRNTRSVITSTCEFLKLGLAIIVQTQLRVKPGVLGIQKDENLKVEKKKKKKKTKERKKKT